MKPPLLIYRLNTFLLLEFYSDQTCLQCEMIDFQSVIKVTCIVIFTEMRVNTMYIGKYFHLYLHLGNCQKCITPTKFDQTALKSQNSYFHLFSSDRSYCSRPLTTFSHNLLTHAKGSFVIQFFFFLRRSPLREARLFQYR